MPGLPVMVDQHGAFPDGKDMDFGNAFKAL
jgi:hypothetical protein